MPKFGEYMESCPHLQDPELQPRPVNGFNVEIGRPQSRCLLMPPCWHGGNLAWWLSGGSLLDYGVCRPEECPRLKDEQ